MKRKPFASIIALIFATIVLVFQFMRISFIGGEWVVICQLPMLASETASLLTIIESVTALLVPATMVVFGILLVIEECRREAFIARINTCLKLMLIPLLLFVLSALEKSVYIYLYEGQFSLEYTWLELVTSISILAVYALTVYKKLKSGYLLVIICLAFVIFEVFRLSIPGFFDAYIVGNNIYVSAFTSVISFYFAYLFLGLSFIVYRLRSAKGERQPSV